MNVYEQTFKKYGLSSTQQKILEIIGKEKTVLEIGSSTGYMTRAFLENGCIVDAVEFDQKAMVKLPKDVRKVFGTSIEDEGVYQKLGDYDFIVMADVLEHLVDPEKVLKELAKVASSVTQLLVSIPNVACWAMRKQLFFEGDFEYQESGLLDKTHLHFYTVNTLPKILLGQGWKVEKIIGTITRLPFEGLAGKIPLVGWIFKKMLYIKLVDRYKNLAYYHFLVVASKE
ncbi:MAG: class I SAM-dependent methyltransferase [bacterium]|nr:class I SAM-dependent methyltransferase [bacterium]